ncbi:hypothetical protein Pmani_017965 [Petrolisthes manimaculis]|uniref:Glycolipid transfer protein domain-containing protein n=1 Tax=Petrolisthes manimaculis TaxID=1843537 RepID=A0AAE1PLD9_9EUCA|nr:hypothetical protein Pmani_017965 [Petrolisthes manimaculis]
MYGLNNEVQVKLPPNDNKEILAKLEKRTNGNGQPPFLPQTEKLSFVWKEYLRRRRLVAHQTKPVSSAKTPKQAVTQLWPVSQEIIPMVTHSTVRPPEMRGVMDDEKSQVVYLDIVISGMTPSEDGRLQLQPYLHAYKEMNKIFQVLGPFFQFVATDVSAKVELLEKLLAGSSGKHYTNIQSMVKYEMDNNLLTTNLGCRTLLRLHRALDLIRGFLDELFTTSEDENSFSRRVSRLYRDTLGNYQNKVLVKTFTGVLLLLPTRQVLIDRVTRGDAKVEDELRKKHPVAVEAVTLMYQATQDLYRENKLLDLP